MQTFYLPTLLAAAILISGCMGPRLNPLQQDCQTRAGWEAFGNCMKDAANSVAPFNNMNNLDLSRLYAQQIDKFGREVMDGIIEEKAAREQVAVFYLDLVHYANVRALKSDVVQGPIRQNEAKIEVMRSENVQNQSARIVAPPVAGNK